LVVVLTVVVVVCFYVDVVDLVLDGLSLDQSGNLNFGLCLLALGVVWFVVRVTFCAFDSDNLIFWEGVKKKKLGKKMRLTLQHKIVILKIILS
jgi:hypothetical protein